MVIFRLRSKMGFAELWVCLALYIIIINGTVSKRGGLEQQLYLDLLRLWRNMDVTATGTRSWELDFYIIIINGTVSKRGGSEWLYLDIIELRCNVDHSNHSWKFELAFYIFILHRAIPNRGG